MTAWRCLPRQGATAALAPNGPLQPAPESPTRGVQPVPGAILCNVPRQSAVFACKITWFWLSRSITIVTHQPHIHDQRTQTQTHAEVSENCMKITLNRLMTPVALLAMVLPFVQALAEPAQSLSVPSTFVWIVLILLAARTASLVERIGQPAVLGELLVGVLLGNLALVGLNGLEPIKTNEIIKFLAELGVVILLFQVGLESNVQQMRRVGMRALSVALVGVMAPFLLGAYLVGPLLLPGLPSVAYLFIGAILTATSVGITARVFRDLGQLQTPEAQVVLGAAVIDDVIGLIILAVVSAIVSAGTVDLGAIVGITGKAIAFLVDKVHPNTLKYTNQQPELEELLKSGVVDAATFWNGVARKFHFDGTEGFAFMIAESGQYAVNGFMWIPVGPKHPVLAQLFIDWRLSDDAQFPDLDAWGISEGWWSELQEGLMGPSYEAAIPDWIADVYFDYYPTIEQLSTLYMNVDWPYYNEHSKDWFDKWLQGIGL